MTTGNILVLNILISVLLDSKWEENDSGLHDSKQFVWQHQPYPCTLHETLHKHNPSNTC